MLDTLTSVRSRAFSPELESARHRSSTAIGGLRRRIERTCSEPTIELRRYRPSDLQQSVDLAQRAYGSGLVGPCVETLRQHAAALQIGFDDGRLLFKATRAGVIVGVCGLHRYVWGPSDVAWLSWFFVAPEARCSPAAMRMFAELLQVGRTMALRALYVETPNGGEEFATVHRYLPRVGFELLASVPDYYGAGTDMLIFMLPLLRQALA